MTARWRIATPRSRPAALAVIELSANTLHDLDTALTQAIGTVPAVGAVVFRPICGIDTGIAARLGPTHAVLMPHGGPAVLDGIASSLTAFGLEEATDPAPRKRYPEAESNIEAEMLAALSRAQSPLAVDLLLDQPQRWGGQTAHNREPNDRDHRLNRLIDPPLIAAAGPPNVGKSSLLNALAGRTAALVADEQGTTRDHIGATIDLAGLVVHWVDTPGRRDASGVEAEAIRNSDSVIDAADLVVAIGDHASPDPRSVLTRAPDLVLAARSDLGQPSWPADCSVSLHDDQALAGLVGVIRDRLVPPADLAWPDAWTFWA